VYNRAIKNAKGQPEFAAKEGLDDLKKAYMAAQHPVVDEFADLINDCRGQVAFVTQEGDRLVANSMLSALVGFSTILSVAETLDIQIECERPEDSERIISFLKKHRLGRYADT
jgi:hypothetical protein